MNSYIQRLTKDVLAGKNILFSQAERLINAPDDDLLLLLDGANKIRNRFRGNKINLCSITNAKSGKCSQDCKFCSQSNFHKTDIKTYSLIKLDKILARAKKYYQAGSNRFCIVVSGRALTKNDFETVCHAIVQIKKRWPNMRRDASLGELTFEMAEKLKLAGLQRYNHNLETVEEFFPKICTTHSFDDRIKTLEVLRKVGLQICSGGIFGLGETKKQRVEFAYFLKELNVDCMPLNFLNPVKGTAFENNKPLKPFEILKTIAMFRFVNPKKQIRICGGREKNLRSLQSLIFFSGCDSIIFGDYLTTKGNALNDDLQMIKDLGLKIR
ncbi:MAG: biotin synthase BioB [Candidatus Omnitrophota bacterium]